MTHQTLALDTMVRRSPGAVTAEVDGQLVALDIANGVCYGLNSVATAIWNRLDQATTPTAIATALAAEYDVDPQDCADQTHALIGDLVQAGLAEVAAQG